MSRRALLTRFIAGHAVTITSATPPASDTPALRTLIPEDRQHGAWWRRLWPWLAAVMLCMPVWLLYGSHVAFGARYGYEPTGVLAYDTTMYASYIREYADRGGWNPFYSNPFDPDAAAPRVYFHLHFYLLSVLHRLGLGTPLGLLLVAGGIAAVVCMRLAIGIYRTIAGLQRPIDALGLIAFCWGGGLLMIAGIVTAFSTGQSLTARTLTRFDPMLGEWSLNLGRNLQLPTEAIYHVLTLGLAAAILTRRHHAAAAVLVVLAFTHPFTALQWGLIFTTAYAAECWIVRRPGAPWWPVAVGAGVLASVLGYYMVYLASVPSHALVMKQWELAWNLSLVTMLLAYGPVAAIVLWRVRSSERLRHVFASPQTRFLLIWFIVSFGLANHELFVTARQPIHFTRGYLWMPLFLLAAPVIQTWLRQLNAATLRPVGLTAAVALTALLVSDNVIWFAHRGGQPHGYYLDADEVALRDHLADTAKTHTLLIEDARVAGNPYDRIVSYRMTAVTPARAWLSHRFTTPDTDANRDALERYFASGEVPDEWAGRDLAILSRTQDAVPTTLTAGAVRHTFGRLTLHRIQPSDTHQAFHDAPWPSIDVVTRDPDRPSGS